ncbi:MAG TPA: tRNA (adenosine(37)-N6)-threonylcarbamoyltransferase complex ATPase subunit type 1 TsaE [Myxococcota bacterium]|nr:tRNA (adenosine(37)-N6)-threonylcarbamoyltransferase complex ATPase subunit type 1 TsaE [Myxococcota bacterium]
MTEEYFLRSAEDTRNLGKKLAKRCEDRPALIYLRGDLGMGKTTLAQGFISSLIGGSVRVQSPTFAYMHRYQHKKPIYHFDLYRIEREATVLELGLNTFIDDKTSLRLIEWPERLGGLITVPPDIDIILTSNNAIRTARVSFACLTP